MTVCVGEGWGVVKLTNGPLPTTLDVQCQMTPTQRPYPCIHVHYTSCDLYYTLRKCMHVSVGRLVGVCVLCVYL